MLSFVSGADQDMLVQNLMMLNLRNCPKKHFAYFEQRSRY